MAPSKNVILKRKKTPCDTDKVSGGPTDNFAKKSRTPVILHDSNQYTEIDFARSPSVPVSQSPSVPKLTAASHSQTVDSAVSNSQAVDSAPSNSQAVDSTASPLVPVGPNAASPLSVSVTIKSYAHSPGKSPTESGAVITSDSETVPKAKSAKARSIRVGPHAESPTGTPSISTESFAESSAEPASISTKSDGESPTGSGRVITPNPSGDNSDNTDNATETAEASTDDAPENASDDDKSTKTAAGALSGQSNNSASSDEESLESDLQSVASRELQTFNTEQNEYLRARAARVKQHEDFARRLAIKTFGPKKTTTPSRKRKSAPRVIVPPRPKSKRKVKETNRLSFGQNGKQQTAKESEQAVKAFFKSDDKLKAGRKGRATAQTMDEDNSEDRKDGSYEYEADVADESSEGVIEENGDEDNAEDDKGAACENQGDGEEEPLEEEVIVEEGDFQPPNSLPGFPTSEPIMLFKSEGCEKLHEVIVLSQGGAPGSISFPVHDKASTIKVAVQKLRPFSDHSTDQLSIIQAIVEEFINHQFEVPVGIFLSM